MKACFLFWKLKFHLFIIMSSFAQKWNRIGKSCIVESDVHILIASMTGNNQKAVLVGISNYGETKEVINIMKLA